MSEREENTERNTLPIRLEFRASEQLKELVGKLIRPELDRAFARSSFLTLYLRSSPPIELPVVDKTSSHRFTPEAAEMRRHYRQDVENITAKDQIFLRPLHITPLFGIKQDEEQSATSILFQLSLSESEKSRLLQPPFDQIDRRMIGIGKTFEGTQLKTGDEFEDSVENIRNQLKSGAWINPVTHMPRAADRYYVTRPTLKP